MDSKCTNSHWWVFLPSVGHALQQVWGVIYGNLDLFVGDLAVSCHNIWWTSQWLQPICSKKLITSNKPAPIGTQQSFFKTQAPCSSMHLAHWKNPIISYRLSGIPPKRTQQLLCQVTWRMSLFASWRSKISKYMERGRTIEGGSSLVPRLKSL